LLLGRFPNRPPFSGFESLAQRPGDVCIVFLAGDFFVRRASQADDVIGGDAAVLRVESCQLGRIEGCLVVNDNGRCGCSARRSIMSTIPRTRDDRQRLIEKLSFRS